MFLEFVISSGILTKILLLDRTSKPAYYKMNREKVVSSQIPYLSFVFASSSFLFFSFVYFIFSRDPFVLDQAKQRL